MAMVLICVVDVTKSHTEALSALGRMMIGWGLIIPEGCMPTIRIFYAAEPVVREFRSRSVALAQAHLQAAIYADLPHTCMVGTATEQARNTINTPEAKISYHAVCCCTEERYVPELCKEISLTHCSEFQSPSNAFRFVPVPVPAHIDFVPDDKACQFAVVLSPKLSTSEAYMAMVRSTLHFSQTMQDPAQLRLHQYLDASATVHPGISEYALVPLTAKNAAKMPGLKDRNAVVIFGGLEQIILSTKMTTCSWKELGSRPDTYFQPGGSPTAHATSGGEEVHPLPATVGGDGGELQQPSHRPQYT